MQTALNPTRLLGDIGGTNARFGWQAQANAEIAHVRTLPCADFPNLEAAVQAYLRLEGLSAPAACALGIANPVTGDHIQMTNRDWSFSIRALQQTLGVARLVVINDFTALALALPFIAPEDLRQIGGTQACKGAAIGLIGPGTGLGVSGLIPVGRSGAWEAISGEGGHASLAAQSDAEYRVLKAIQAQHGHASAERVLSGPGLFDLYAALARHSGQAPQRVDCAADITRLALQDHDPVAVQALDMFAGFLGAVAGDLALTLGARGGIYLGGGILPRWLGWLETSSFRTRFEAKGRFKSYLADIPVYVIHAKQSPALAGAAQALLSTD